LTPERRKGIAQTPWVLPGNNTINPANDWLGSQNNADLLLRTNAIKRFRLLPDATYTVGSFSKVRNGSLLLCPKVDNFYINGAPGPYSLLHLAAETNNAQQGSDRGWMDIGVTFTGNKDHGYVGQKYRMYHGEPLNDFALPQGLT